MPALKEGIPLHQPVAKVHKANKRPLYVGVGLLTAVVICFFWAFIKAGERQATVRSEQAAAARGEPVPALGARQSLDKELKAKHPLEMPGTGKTAISATPPPLAHRDIPSLDSAAAHPEGTHASEDRQPNRQLGTREPPPLTPEQQMEWQAYQDEQKAIEAPLLAQPGGSAASPPLSNGGPDPLTNALWAAQTRAADANNLPKTQETERDARTSPDDYGRQNGQGDKAAYAREGKPAAAILVGPARPGPEPGCIIHAGWDIPAELEQSAVSDLPGHLRARVRLNVHDSKTGTKVCIPQNSILLGNYNANVTYAQNRLQVRWHTLQLPDNTPDIDLDNMSGLDAAGNAGLTGRVDNHFKRLIGFALLSSAFAAGIEISQNRNANASTFAYPSSTQVVGQAVGQELGEFGRKVTERNLNRQPTLLIPAGTHFNVRVDRALVFTTPYQG